LVRCSPLALSLCGTGFRVFALPGPEIHLMCSRVPLMGFGSPSEEAQAPSRCIETRFSALRRPDHSERLVCSASREVSAPSAFPHPGQRHEWLGLPTQPPAPSGSHNLLAPSSAPSLPALFHAGSAPGATLQSFLPLTQPYAVSSVVPLLAFWAPSGFCSA
jgi:hypothetical protein